MRKPALTLACLMASMAQAAPVTELNPLVVTASRSEHSLADAPASVSVITAEQIKARGAGNLLEALRGVPGLSLNGRQVGGRKTLSIRGAEDRHTLVLIDGRRISSTDDTIGHSDYQYGWVAMEQIERIEVVRGPMSALYGSEAVGGVINIITRKGGQQWHGGASVRGELGEGPAGDGHQMSASASGPLGEWFDLALGVEDRRRAPTPRPENKATSDIEGQDRQSGNLRLGFTPSEGQRLQLDMLRSEETRRRHEQNTRLPARPYYLDTYDLQRRQDALTWQADWSLLRSELRYSEAEFEVNNKRSNNIAPTRPQRLEDRVWDGNLAFALGDSHSLTLGAERREEFLENAGLSGGSDSALHKALYVQDEIALADDWALTLGTRLDHHAIFGSESSPRAYLVWRASPELTIKGGYGEAFRAPTLKQISPNYVGAEGPHTFLGNADIQPETSRSWEIGADWRDEQSAYTATLFRSEIKDLIYYNLLRRVGPRSIYQYDNISEARIDGLEVALRRALGGGFSLASSMTWLDARDRDSDDKLTGRPEFSATPSLAWQQGAWGAELEWQYIGQQTLQNAAGQLKRAPAYSLVNLSGSYRVDEHLTLRAGLNNAGDLRLEDKSELFGYVEDGRTLWLGLEASF
ncbi:addiction module protein [Pseudomonas fluvialis]|uniref:TonB-dependent receptor n=2 Tax=Pseudomonas fluvialis TaxID=1793966 RepID=A0ABQ2AH97_9PSED|nr:addiction module protein [Pseudomonas fluvialis]GGH90607.1 TonB-dependent receptor [Pseudomonas fluvialis]